MNKNIHTLEQLEQEKKKLDLMMELTKDSFFKSIKNNKKEINSFLLKKVALPAGAIGLGTLAAKKLLSSSDEETESTQKSKGSETSGFTFIGLLSGLLPIAIKLLQTYFMKKQHEQIVETKQKINSPLRQVS